MFLKIISILGHILKSHYSFFWIFHLKMDGNKKKDVFWLLNSKLIWTYRVSHNSCPISCYGLFEPIGQGLWGTLYFLSTMPLVSRRTKSIFTREDVREREMKREAKRASLPFPLSFFPLLFPSPFWIPWLLHFLYKGSDINCNDGRSFPT